MEQPPRRPARPPQQPQPQRRYTARRRRKRRQRFVLAALLVVLLAGILLVALLVGGGKPDSSSSSSSQAPASSVPAVSPSSSVSSSAPSAPSNTREVTPYDEEAIPPLFNYENFIPDSYYDNFEMKDVGGGQQMEVRAADAFLAMKAAAKADGIELTPVSGYRSHERQTNNYNASIQRHMNNGLSREEATKRTQGYYAIPGTSEHEAGLAMDIGWIERSFEDSDAFAWLQQHAVEYGFIMRYADDTFDITRINYEPWHYRYVGANHAEQIVAQGVTLEEYVIHPQTLASQLG